MGLIRGSTYLCPKCRVTFKYKNNFLYHKCIAINHNSKRGGERQTKKLSNG